MLRITTQPGASAHSVETDAHELAQCVYAHALNLDDEPELSRMVGGWCVRFVASDAECLEAVKSALAARGGGK